jgi:multiple sugar transport system permease protein
MHESLSSRILRGFVIAALIVWSAVPVGLIVLSSFKPTQEIFSYPPSLVFEPTLEHYRNLFEKWPDFLRTLLNSAIIALFATALTVVASLLAGFVYSRYRGRALGASAIFMVAIRLLPPIVITLPLFPLFSWLHLNDTHLVLMLLYAAFFVSLATWIMRAFIEQVPKELEEAAVVDGASLMQTLVKVVLPLVLNGVMAAALFVIVYAWNEFIFALVFTTRVARTTPLVMSEMLSTTDGVDWGVLFAAATLQLAPVLAFILSAQRYVIAGLTAGAVKG